MKKAYLSLGSNLGDRAENLAEALRLLPHPRLAVTRVSAVYETEPVGVVDQPWFLNQVVEIETSLFPMMLIKHTQAIEREMGRRRTAANGPRIIDIDILLYAQFIVDTPRLVIPHKELHKRRFVLEPLCELIPDVRHPAMRKTFRELLAAAERKTVRKL